MTLVWFPRPRQSTFYNFGKNIRLCSVSAEKLLCAHTPNPVEWGGIVGAYSTGKKRTNNAPEWPQETTWYLCQAEVQQQQKIKLCRQTDDKRYKIGLYETK